MTLENHDLKYRRLDSSRAALMPLHDKHRRHGVTRAAFSASPAQRLISFGRSLPQAAVLTLALVLCAGIWIGLSALPPRQAKKDTAPGLMMLDSLEQRDPQAVDELLRARQPEPEAPPLTADGALDIDPEQVWGQFHDYVLLGDSRAVGFYYFDFLDPNRVLADGGDTIRQIEEHMEEIAALQPTSIYLCYGLNDVSIGYWDTPEDYVEEYMGIVDTLNQRLPGATVVISSILPARDPAFDMSSAWYNIPDFNTALSAACREKGVAFVDNDAISEAYADCWQPDGIHVDQRFYPYWAKNLLEAVLTNGNKADAA